MGRFVSEARFSPEENKKNISDSDSEACQALYSGYRQSMCGAWPSINSEAPADFMSDFITLLIASDRLCILPMRYFQNARRTSSPNDAVLQPLGTLLVSRPVAGCSVH